MPLRPAILMPKKMKVRGKRKRISPRTMNERVILMKRKGLKKSCHDTYIKGVNKGGVAGGRDGYPEGEIAGGRISHGWASSQK